MEILRREPNPGETLRDWGQCFTACVLLDHLSADLQLLGILVKYFANQAFEYVHHKPAISVANQMPAPFSKCPASRFHTPSQIRSSGSINVYRQDVVRADTTHDKTNELHLVPFLSAMAGRGLHVLIIGNAGALDPSASETTRQFMDQPDEFPYGTEMPAGGLTCRHPPLITLWSRWRPFEY